MLITDGWRGWWRRRRRLASSSRLQDIALHSQHFLPTVPISFLVNYCLSQHSLFLPCACRCSCARRSFSFLSSTSSIALLSPDTDHFENFHSRFLSSYPVFWCSYTCTHYLPFSCSILTSSLPSVHFFLSREDQRIGEWRCVLIAGSMWLLATNIDTR